MDPYTLKYVAVKDFEKGMVLRKLPEWGAIEDIGAEFHGRVLVKFSDQLTPALFSAEHERWMRVPVEEVTLYRAIVKGLGSELVYPWREEQTLDTARTIIRWEKITGVVEVV